MPGCGVHSGSSQEPCPASRHPPCGPRAARGGDGGPVSSWSSPSRPANRGARRSRTGTCPRHRRARSRAAPTAPGRRARPGSLPASPCRPAPSPDRAPAPAAPISSPDDVSHSTVDSIVPSSRPNDEKVAARSWRPADRRRSIARFRAIVSSQAGRAPRDGSNSSARFHRVRNVSWTTSAAIPRSRLTRMAVAKTAWACLS